MFINCSTRGGLNAALRQSSFKANDGRLMGGNEIGAVSTGVDRFQVGATFRAWEAIASVNNLPFHSKWL